LKKLTNDFEKKVDPPVDLLDAPLDSSLVDEFIQLVLTRLELALAWEETRGVHC